MACASTRASTSGVLPPGVERRDGGVKVSRSGVTAADFDKPVGIAQQRPPRSVYGKPAEGLDPGHHVGFSRRVRRFAVQQKRRHAAFSPLPTS